MKFIKLTEHGPPIFEYVGHRTANMHIEPTDHKGHRLRIGPGQTVVHNLWDVLWGRDRNKEFSKDV